MIASQPIQVQCPQCNQPFTALVQTIIDVGQQPELKEQLLRGRLNLARCPACGVGSVIGTPLLYHDPDKELAFVLMPTEMNVPHAEQERLIGRLTNTLIDALPPEKRKGYLFQPKTFLTLDSLIRAVLAADGITEEMLQAQQQRIQLIEDLRNRLDNAEQFDQLLEEHRSEIDYELFLILRAMIDTARQEGLGDEAQALDRLRQRLVDATGGPAPAHVEIETFDDLLNLLQEVDDKEQLQAMVASNRAIFDYNFFQQLTAKMQAAEQAGDAARAAQLLQLRQDLVEATDAVDQATQATLENAAQRLREILRAEDPRSAAREQLDEIDEACLLILSANIAQAEEQGHREIAHTLRDLYDYIVEQLEERMPPQVRVLNRLLQAETEEEQTRVLETVGDALDDSVVSVLEAMADDARAHGQTAVVSELERLTKLANDFLQGKHDN